MLRAMEQYGSETHSCRFMQEFSTQKEFQDFLQLIKNVYIDLPPLYTPEEMSAKLYDRMKYGHDLLLHKVTAYVIKTKR